MNGNVTKDGIVKDLAWMKRVGIGGLQNFDANLATPQIVEKRLVYMQPDWKDAFRLAVSEADRLGLDFGIASSPGWSETGGPWVLPQDGLKKLVWSETGITGRRRYRGKLASPPSVIGAYQSLPKEVNGAMLGSEEGGATRPVPYYADVAMAPLWTFARQDGSELTYLANMKGAASVAHVYGQNMASAESMTSIMTPWAFGPADLKRVKLGRFDGPWQVAFEPGRDAPATVRLATLTLLNEHQEAAIRYFPGIATYSHLFQAPKGWKPGKPLWIDLGEAKEVAEVTVNGMAVGGVWHAPYRIDISAAVRPGRNALQVRVGNLWVNRLVGDAQPGAAKIGWTGLPTYSAQAPLRRSGLIGPAMTKYWSRL